MYFVVKNIKMENITVQQNLSRLRWQCRRGMLELDIFLDEFLAKGYKGLDDEQRQTFEEVLSLSDQMLLEYLLGQTKPIDKEIAYVIQQIRNSAGPET